MIGIELLAPEKTVVRQTCRPFLATKDSNRPGWLDQTARGNSSYINVGVGRNGFLRWRGGRRVGSVEVEVVGGAIEDEGDQEQPRQGVVVAPRGVQLLTRLD